MPNIRFQKHTVKGLRLPETPLSGPAHVYSIGATQIAPGRWESHINGHPIADYLTTLEDTEDVTQLLLVAANLGANALRELATAIEKDTP